MSRGSRSQVRHRSASMKGLDVLFIMKQRHILARIHKIPRYVSVLIHGRKISGGSALTAEATSSRADTHTGLARSGAKAVVKNQEMAGRQKEGGGTNGQAHDRVTLSRREERMRKRQSA